MEFEMSVRKSLEVACCKRRFSRGLYVKDYKTSGWYFSG